MNGEGILNLSGLERFIELPILTKDYYETSLMF